SRRRSAGACDRSGPWRHPRARRSRNRLRQCVPRARRARLSADVEHPSIANRPDHPRVRAECRGRRRGRRGVGCCAGGRLGAAACGRQAARSRVVPLLLERPAACARGRSADAALGGCVLRAGSGRGVSASSQGAKFRAAVEAEKPLQVVGAINAYAARMAERVGFKALYLSGGGVAANSLGMPDLAISTQDDVLTDVRRITDVTTLPLLVDIDTGWGSAFNIARTIRAMIKAGAAAVHIEDQAGAKRCGHRPGKEVVAKQEMVDRVKAAVDARTDPSFVIMARTDALAVEGIDAAIDRAVAYVEAGADMIFT